MRNIGVNCDESECAFWSALGEESRPQCALQYFQLLDAGKPGLAKWLLELKEEQLADLLGMRPLGAGDEAMSH